MVPADADDVAIHLQGHVLLLHAGQVGPHPGPGGHSLPLRLNSSNIIWLALVHVSAGLKHRNSSNLFDRVTIVGGVFGKTPKPK
jgi:hypothetical protein